MAQYRQADPGHGRENRAVPGRHEPQYGEVNMPHCFDAIDTLGYTGWVGCEYRPKGDTLEGLTWAYPYGIGLGAA